MDVFRVYQAHELGKDGYPPEWHKTIKHAIREQAGYRCVRCGHPYRNGEHGNGEWSRCDERCDHGGPAEVFAGGLLMAGPDVTAEEIARQVRHGSGVYAQWRILTVHHLDGDKANCPLVEPRRPLPTLPFADPRACRHGARLAVGTLRVVPTLCRRLLRERLPRRDPHPRASGGAARGTARAGARSMTEQLALRRVT